MDMQYECKYVENIVEADWNLLPDITLLDVVTGDKPRLHTSVRACWSQEGLHVRFDCEDDHIIATMINRDDPIYNEDVVEVFIDTTGTGYKYFEFEVSPRNVIFDAKIEITDMARAQGERHSTGTGDTSDYKTVDIAWDAHGMRTSVDKLSEGQYRYELHFPFADLEAVPDEGTVWKWNAYRIDGDQSGKFHFWAWSPTGAVNYHVPSKFGELKFVK